MSFRRNDLRFALAVPVRENELVVTPAERLDEALAAEPTAFLVIGGRPARALRARGYEAVPLLPLPNAAEPELLVPAGQAGPVRYAIRGWRPGTSAATRARNLVAREALARGLVPAGREAVTAASRVAGPPFFVAAASERLGLDAAGWFASFGQWPQPHSRGAFYLFRAGEAEPAWVLKFARVTGLEELFDRDERGLNLAARSPEIVARHAPRLVGRFEVDGLHASVETAAVGERLPAVLEREGLAALERLAAWLVQMAEETVAPPETLEPERERLRGLVDALPPVPAVLQHGDLGGDNAVFGRDDFTVVDWESAREHGFPLWDLFYLLTGGLATLDGLRDEGRRDEHFARLWRGELPSSEVLFRWTRRAVEALDLAPEAVGPLATGLWRSYAAHDAETAAKREHEPATVRFARRWTSDPALGSGWSAWR
jgi:hypothetical protein